MAMMIPGDDSPKLNILRRKQQQTGRIFTNPLTKRTFIQNILKSRPDSCQPLRIMSAHQRADDSLSCSCSGGSVEVGSIVLRGE